MTVERTKVGGDSILPRIGSNFPKSIRHAVQYMIARMKREPFCPWWEAEKFYSDGRVQIKRNEPVEGSVSYDVRIRAKRGWTKWANLKAPDEEEFRLQMDEEEGEED